MAISLSKGGNVSLSKEAPNLKNILIGLGWDARATDGGNFDLDGSLFALNSSEKVRSDSDFIFYNNLKSSDGSIQHTGDNTTGEGDGDDEAIKVALDKVPIDIEKMAISVTIHEANARKQNFGMVKNAFIRIVNSDNNQEIARFDLSEDMSTEISMIFGEIYRHNGEWKFKAIGQGFKDGLSALCRNFGVNV
jgi:tellurium resistance protein TerD